jgi:hypothetical protein
MAVTQKAVLLVQYLDICKLLFQPLHLQQDAEQSRPPLSFEPEQPS